MLAACSGSGSSQSSASAEASSTSETAESSVDAQTGENASGISAASTVAEVQSDTIDSISVGISSDIGDFAPWGNSLGRTNALWGIYETLADVIGDEVYGVLMKDYSIADDYMSIDIELYDNITDSKGNSIKASDVVFSYEQAAASGKITAINNISSVEATGELTATIYLKNKLQLGNLDSIFGRWNIVSQQSYEESPDGMSQDPVGSGPYVLTSYTSGYEAVYTARDDYWQTDPSLIHLRNAANAREIHYYIISEASQMAISLGNGTIDVSASVSTDDLAKFQEGGEYSDEYWVYTVPDNLSMTLFCNMSEGKVTEDINLRKAIYYAINNEAILESVFQGRGSVMYDLAADWAIGYNEDWENEDNYYHYDLDKAKEYLSQSSYNGETLTLMCESSTNANNAATLILSLLQEAGINVEIESVESTVFSSYIQDPDNWDILLTNEATDTYTAAGYDMPLDAKRYSWNGTINFAQDETLQEMLLTCMDQETSTQENLDALHEYVIENAYAMGLVNMESSIVVPKEMTDVILSNRKTIIAGGCLYDLDE